MTKKGHILEKVETDCEMEINVSRNRFNRRDKCLCFVMAGRTLITKKKMIM